MDLVPIKVKITLGTKMGSRMQYPDFNKACANVLQGQDWAVYVDQFGGPHYDHKSPMLEHTEDVPHGEQYVMYMVKADFAKAALAAFPDLVTELTEAEAKTFHDECAHEADPEHRMNTERLNEIRARYGIQGDILSADTSGMDAADAKALDPDDVTPGIVKNRRKHFIDLKRSLNIKVVSTKTADEPSE